MSKWSFAFARQSWYVHACSSCLSASERHCEVVVNRSGWMRLFIAPSFAAEAYFAASIDANRIMFFACRNRFVAMYIWIWRS